MYRAILVNLPTCRAGVVRRGCRVVKTAFSLGTVDAEGGLVGQH